MTIYRDDTDLQYATAAVQELQRKQAELKLAIEDIQGQIDLKQQHIANLKDKLATAMAARAEAQAGAEGEPEPEPEEETSSKRKKK